MTAAPGTSTMSIWKSLFGISMPGAYSWIAGGVLALWAHIPGMMQTWMILACIDWFTGAVNAGLAGRFCMRESLEGLWRKVVTLILTGAAHRIIAPLGLSADVCNTITIAFVANETISIVLNAADAGAPIPPALLAFLAGIRKMTGRGESAKDVRAVLEGKKRRGASAGGN